MGVLDLFTGPEEGRALPATPEGVIAICCQPGMASSWGSRRDEETRVTASAGFLGYPLCDEGYEAMSLLPRPWRVEPRWGDWPYHWAAANAPGRAVLTYCEGDLLVEVADDDAAYRELLARTEAAMNLGNG